MLKIAFWGLGSIARRHIRNLDEILRESGRQFSIDVFRHAPRPIEDPQIAPLVGGVYTEAELADKQYDIIFVTNPTSMHLNAVQVCAAHAKHLFIEKPVFSDCDVDISRLGLKQDSVYYVACPLRYTGVLQYVKENIDPQSVFCARAISSSYLPDWRPDTDYRNTYSAHKALGGGVAIDLIHEWDYLTNLFGLPEQVHYVGGKYSDLEIDSDDLAVYMGIYPNRVVELHLDYFGRKTQRELMLFTKDDVIKADLTNCRVEYLRSGKTVDLTEPRDAFQKRELRHFLEITQGLIENDSTIGHGLAVLRIAMNRSMG